MELLLVVRTAEARVKKVYNAVDLAEFSIASVGPEIRAELGISPETNVLMAIGSVQRVKGHWLLLDALARPELADADLVLVTGGVALGYASTAKGRIKRSLNMPLDNLDALLRDADERGLRNRIHVTGFRRDVARVLSAAAEKLGDKQAASIEYRSALALAREFQPAQQALQRMNR